MPKLFAEGKANLKNPPKIYTEVAIEQVPGIISFFQNDVPLAFKDVKDTALQNEFGQSNGAVIKELQAWLTWLKQDLAAPIQRRFPPGRRQLQQEASLRRNGGYSAR